MQGIVIKSTGSWYTVRGDDQVKTDCRIKGNFRIKGIKSTNPIAVGDRVDVDLEESLESPFPPGEGFRVRRGMITRIHERKNYIIRKSTNLSKQWHIIAANIDMAFLVVTVTLPKTSFGFMDRFLATAEAYRIPVTIIFNKSDLYTGQWKDELKKRMEIYEAIGYQCLTASVVDKTNIEEINNRMKGNTNLVAGHSGVGKSSLINCIQPSLSLKVGALSDAHFKGTHTTTFAEMFELDNGGFIIDTPGIKEFGIIDMEKNELSHFFPEIFKISRNCKFNSCLHLNEPKCAVKEAVEKGEIAISRFSSYLGILTGEELEKEYD